MGRHGHPDLRFIRMRKIRADPDEKLRIFRHSPDQPGILRAVMMNRISGCACLLMGVKNYIKKRLLTHGIQPKGSTRYLLAFSTIWTHFSSCRFGTGPCISSIPRRIPGNARFFVVVVVVVVLIRYLEKNLKYN